MFVVLLCLLGGEGQRHEQRQCSWFRAGGQHRRFMDNAQLAERDVYVLFFFEGWPVRVRLSFASLVLCGGGWGVGR